MKTQAGSLAIKKLRDSGVDATLGETLLLIADGSPCGFMVHYSAMEEQPLERVEVLELRLLPPKLRNLAAARGGLLFRNDVLHFMNKVVDRFMARDERSNEPSQLAFKEVLVGILQMCESLDMALYFGDHDNGAQWQDVPVDDLDVCPINAQLDYLQNLGKFRVRPPSSSAEEGRFWKGTQQGGNAPVRLIKIEEMLSFILNPHHAPHTAQGLIYACGRREGEDVSEGNIIFECIDLPGVAVHLIGVLMRVVNAEDVARHASSLTVDPRSLACLSSQIEEGSKLAVVYATKLTVFVHCDGVNGAGLSKKAKRRQKRQKRDLQYNRKGSHVALHNIGCVNAAGASALPASQQGPSSSGQGSKSGVC